MKNLGRRRKVDRYSVSSRWVILLCLFLVDYSYGIEEHYTVTGTEFLSKIKSSGYLIELLQIVDGEHEKKIPLDGPNHLCRFNRKSELILKVTIRGYDSIVCRLNVFTANDTLAEGWLVNRMQWRGDHLSAEFSVDPRDTRKPHFSVELRLEKIEGNKLKEKKVRLLVVKLSGPSGKSWQEAMEMDSQG